MKQSKKQSLYETVVSTMIGFVVSLVSVISIGRGYLVRRYFNSKIIIK